MCLNLNLNLSESEFAWIWFLPKNLKRKYFPKHVWREITTPKYLNKFSTQESRKIGKRNRYPNYVWRQNLFDDDMYLTKNSLKRHLCQTNFNRTCIKKILYETCLPQPLWREVCTKQFSNYVKGNSQPNKLCIKVSSKQITKRNLYQRILEETCLPNIVWRRTSTKKYMKRNLSPETFSNNISTKNYPNRNFYQKKLKKHSGIRNWSEISTKKSLKRHFPS